MSYDLGESSLDARTSDPGRGGSMRAVRALGIAVAVAALSSAALAQGTPNEQGAQAEPATQGAPEPAAKPDGEPQSLSVEPAPALGAEDGQAKAEAPDVYTVKPGDTLWDLSGRFLNNPWYWPKVWSYNPEISNPHFIYPGNAVRLQPGGQPGAPEVADEFKPPSELDDLSRADTKKPQEFGDGDDVAVVGPYRIGYVAPKGMYARHDSFVTKRELEESGTITASFEEKSMLTLQDEAYVQFAKPAKVKKGETYVLYRTERPVHHPATGELFGYQTTIVGSAKVVAVDDKAVTIQIAQAYDPIERGTHLGPWTEKFLKQVQRRPNDRQLKGFIIAAQETLVTDVAEHHVVFVDKGRADGVEEGNVFTVIRSGDPLGRDMNEIMHDPNLPTEDVGSLLIVDAQQSSSAALVVRSERELYVGDWVEMRPAAAKAGGAASGK